MEDLGCSGWVVEELVVRSLSVQRSSLTSVSLVPGGSQGWNGTIMEGNIVEVEGGIISVAVKEAVDRFHCSLRNENNCVAEQVKLRYAPGELQGTRFYWPKIEFGVLSRAKWVQDQMTVVTGATRLKLEEVMVDHPPECALVHELPKLVAPEIASSNFEPPKSKGFWSVVLDDDCLSSEDHSAAMNCSTSEEAITEAEDVQAKPFCCKLCTSRFKRKRNLNEHNAHVHENIRPYTCPQCNVSFGKRSNLKKHVDIVHEKRRPFSCDMCDAAFGQRTNLQSHVRVVHLREKNFHCHICAMQFGQKSALNMHIRAVHMKERPHKCESCESSFGHKGDLNRHVRAIHDRERLHHCPFCNSSFGRKSVLQAHKNSVHGIDAQVTDRSS
uniref:C2H2-type domain-containing protein n=1 Tax=Compsopogon caeruleus TaxID=31354 RepID=A0A7S1XEW5_9RHOD